MINVASKAKGERTYFEIYADDKVKILRKSDH